MGGHAVMPVVGRGEEGLNLLICGSPKGGQLLTRLAFQVKRGHINLPKRPYGLACKVLKNELHPDLVEIYDLQFGVGKGGLTCLTLYEGSPQVNGIERR